MDDEIIVKLSEWGCNTDDALERILNDKALYISLVKRYCNDLINDMENIKSLLHSKEYSEAFDIAHCIKGVTGNLGLDPLTEIICKVVEPLRSGNYGSFADEINLFEVKRSELEQLIN